MTGNKTRIGSLIRERNDILKTAGELEQICVAAQKEEAAAKTLMQAAGLSGSLEFLANGARNRLAAYADLLTRAIEETEIQWPPAGDRDA